MKVHSRIIALIATASLFACASSPGTRFDKIVPGMNISDVEKVMGEGPSRFENIAGTEYASWYWGDDYCVLLKDKSVVAKDSTRTGRSASAVGVSYEEKKMAQCLAPGQSIQTGTSRVINIPGIGTVRLPVSQLGGSG